MRCVIARVLPLPAPASTTTGPRSEVATARCCSSSPASTDSARESLTSGTPRVCQQVPTLWQAGRMSTAAPGTSLTMYTTPWCGYCQRLKAQLTREEIAFEEIDIEQHPDAADFVMSVNGGNQTVPTVVFPDGSAATNPSIAEVKQRLGL